MRKTSRAEQLLHRIVNQHNFETRIGLNDKDVVVRKWPLGVACGCQICKDACKILKIDPLGMWTYTNDNG
jgi:hypothetical protein